MKKMIVSFHVLLLGLVGLLAACGPAVPLGLFGGSAWVDAPLEGATLPNDVPYEIVAHVESQNGTTMVLINVDPVEVGDPSVMPEVFSFEIGSDENGESLNTLRQLWRPKAPGLYLISVEWEDDTGNTGVSAARQVTVDGEAPQQEPQEDPAATEPPGADTPTPTFTPTFTPTLPAPTAIPPTPTNTPVPAGSISGRVHDNFNNGIGNATVTLRSGNCGGGIVGVAQTTTTDSNGGYSWPGLTGSNYCLGVQYVSLPASSLGWDPINPDFGIGESPSIAVGLSPGENKTANFEFMEVEPPS